MSGSSGRRRLTGLSVDLKSKVMSIPNDEPLQTEEAVGVLNVAGECALVHADSRTEVYVLRDRHNLREPWRITYWTSEIPSPTVLKLALALGFELRSQESRRGTLYQLHRNCVGERAAVMSALRLTRILPGIPVDAWLWVTIYEYDQREEMPAPPVPWPPVK